MVDLARLDIVIDSSEAVRADAALDRLEQTARQADAATEQLTDATRRLTGQQRVATTTTRAESDAARALSTRVDEASRSKGRSTGRTREQLTATEVWIRRLEQESSALARESAATARSASTGERAVRSTERQTRARERSARTTERAARATDRFARSQQELGRVAGAIRNPLDAVVGSVTALALSFAGFQAVRGSVSVLVGFELALAQVRAIAIDTTDTLVEQEAQFAALTEQARVLGATTRFTAQQAGEAQLFLARAGFEVEEILAALPATLNLAAAGYLDLGEAADIASNVLSQFGLSASELTGVTDVLVEVANSANTDIRQLAEALKFAGPFAGALGKDVGETAAALGALGNAGIQASLAGTNLRGIFVRLLSPATQEAADTLDLLASRVGETRAAFDVTERSVADIFAVFQEAGASAQELEAIFGRLNVSAAAALTGQAGAIQELTEAAAESRGAAADLADTINNTLDGSFRSLLSAAQNLVLAIGDAGLATALQDSVDTTAGFLRVLGGVGTEADDASDRLFALELAARAGVGALAALAAPAILRGVAGLASGLALATARAAGLRVSLAGAAVALGPAQFVALAGAAIGLATAFDSGSSAAERLTEALDAQDDTLEGLISATSRATDALANLAAARAIGDQDAELRAVGAAARELEEALIAIERSQQAIARGDDIADTIALGDLPVTADQLDTSAVEEEVEREIAAFRARVEPLLEEAFTFDGRRLIFREDRQDFRGRDQGFGAIAERVESSVVDLEASFTRAVGTIEGLDSELSDALVEQFSNIANEPARQLQEEVTRLGEELGVASVQIERAFVGFNAQFRALSTDAERAGAGDLLFANLVQQGVGTGTADRIRSEAAPVLETLSNLTGELSGALSAEALTDALFSGDFGDLPSSFRISLDLAETLLQELAASTEVTRAEIVEAARQAAVAAESAASGDGDAGGIERRNRVALDSLIERLRVQADSVRLSQEEAQAQQELATARELSASAGNDADRTAQILEEVRALQELRAERQSELELERQTETAIDAVITARANIVDALRDELDALREKRTAQQELTREEEIQAAIAQDLADLTGLSAQQRSQLTGVIVGLVAAQRALNAELAEERRIQEETAAQEAALARIERATEATARRAAALTGESEAARLRQSLERDGIAINDELAASLQRLAAAEEALAEAREQKKQTTDEEKQTSEQLNTTIDASERVNRGLADTLTDVITNTKGAEEAFAQFYQALVNSLLRQSLFELFSGGESGGGIGSLFSFLTPGTTGGSENAKGNAFDSNGIIRRFDLGGVFNSDGIEEFRLGGLPGLRDLPRIGNQPALFQTPDGRVNSIRENNQPEAIFPLGRDSQGRLGVRIVGESRGQAQSRRASTTNDGPRQQVNNFFGNNQRDAFAQNPRQARRYAERKNRGFN